MDLDATDLRLLDLLQADASLSNQDLAERGAHLAGHRLRRVRRLVDAGVIERRVALLSPEQLGARPHGAGGDHARPPGRRAPGRLRGSARWPTPAVQQCYRVSPGPDFVLVVHVRRHGGLPRAGAAPVHAGRQRAQREGLLQRASAPSSTRAIGRSARAQAARQQRQALEVFAFGEDQRRRVVAARLPGAAGWRRRRRRRWPAPATILWNSSAPMPPEQLKVNSSPPGASSISARRLMSL